MDKVGGCPKAQKFSITELSTEPIFELIWSIVLGTCVCFTFGLCHLRASLAAKSSSVHLLVTNSVVMLQDGVRACCRLETGLISPTVRR